MKVNHSSLGRGRAYLSGKMPSRTGAVAIDKEIDARESHDCGRLGVPDSSVRPINKTPGAFMRSEPGVPISMAGRFIFAGLGLTALITGIPALL
jgi:hypothetical protein